MDQGPAALAGGAAAERTEEKVSSPRFCLPAITAEARMILSGRRE